jgi:hypothetical protein
MTFETEREHLEKRLAELRKIHSDLTAVVQWFAHYDKQLKSCILHESLYDSMEQIDYVANDIQLELTLLEGKY